jgi:hypothetical protein
MPGFRPLSIASPARLAAPLLLNCRQTFVKRHRSIPTVNLEKSVILRRARNEPFSLLEAGDGQLRERCVSNTVSNTNFHQITSESLKANRHLKPVWYPDGTQRGWWDGAVLEVLIIKRSSTKWEWRLCDRYGATIIGGFESTRPAANYRGNRELFLALCTRRRR